MSECGTKRLCLPVAKYFRCWRSTGRARGGAGPSQFDPFRTSARADESRPGTPKPTTPAVNSTQPASFGQMRDAQRRIIVSDEPIFMHTPSRRAASTAGAVPAHLPSPSQCRAATPASREARAWRRRKPRSCRN